MTTSAALPAASVMDRSAARDKLIVALDFPEAAPALALVHTLGDTITWYKVGLELFSADGHRVIREVRDLGKRLFLDVKFHDIPNTVAGASAVVGGMGVDIFNVHASGGTEMMRAAKTAAADGATRAGLAPPRVYGVTILTSLSDAMLRDDLGFTGDAKALVPHFAARAQAAGLDGVVASPQEITGLREQCGDEFGILTPGIRPAGAAANDQQRTATPARAVEDGANYLVVGRPITQAQDPPAAAAAILDEMAGVA